MGFSLILYLEMEKIKIAFQKYFSQLNDCGNIASLPYEWNLKTQSYQRRENISSIALFTRLVVALNVLILLTTIYSVFSTESLANKIASIIVAGINLILTRIRILHSSEIYASYVVAFINSLWTSTEGEVKNNRLIDLNYCSQQLIFIIKGFQSHV